MVNIWNRWRLELTSVSHVSTVELILRKRKYKAGSWIGTWDLRVRIQTLIAFLIRYYGKPKNKTSYLFSYKSFYQLKHSATLTMLKQYNLRFSTDSCKFKFIYDTMFVIFNNRRLFIIWVNNVVLFLDILIMWHWYNVKKELSLQIKYYNITNLPHFLCWIR